MHSFTDTHQRTWELAVNIAGVARVRDRLGVDLLEITQTDLLQKLADDYVLLVNVIYVLCQEQCERAGVSDVAFGAGFSGVVLDRAVEALIEELISFFPPLKRASLQRARSLQLEIETTQAETLFEIWGRIEREIADATLEVLAARGNGFLRPAESSDSTPAPSPSANSAGCAADESASGGSTPATSSAPTSAATPPN